MKTLLIMAGGTGGHVMPALAVANNLRERGVNIIWMGTRNGIEYELVPAAGFELKLVNVKGLRGSGWKQKLSAPVVLLTAAYKALKIILTSKAHAILGMGGFVSGPGGVAARLIGRPLVLHEQNAVAGTTNKLLAPLANRVLTGFEHVSSLKAFEHVGNPVKKEIVAIEPPAHRLAKRDAQFNILVIGGSQGAGVFNQQLPELLDSLTMQFAGTPSVAIHHQCGKHQMDDVNQRYSALGLTAQVSGFIDDMATAYAWSDIVICRSGAMTVAEVAAAGAVALFVPYPYAIDDHQFYNAKAMVEEGAALCLRQEEFVKGRWVAELKGLAENREALVKMAVKARSFARPNAARNVADICVEVMNA